MPGPLDGVRIVDCSAILSGPLATMILADQGAEVIKVEPPGLGDLLRLSPYVRGGLGAFFVNGNRGKRAIALDLQKARGREILLDLVRRADVFVQNFRPGAVERLGIAEKDLRAVAPDLVYVSISGFGESGPYADRRVYDPVIQALSGTIAIQRHPDSGERDLVRHVVCDKASAYTAAQAITAALYARARGKGGQHVRLAMLDAAIAFFWPDGMMEHTMVGPGVERAGPTLYQIYRLTETADGHLIYFAVSDAEFHGLFRALGHPEWCEDVRFKDFPGRMANGTVLEPLLRETFRSWPTADVLARMAAESLPVAPVLSLDEVLADPQVKHNEILLEREHPTAGIIRQPRPPAKFDRTPAEAGRLAPRHGEHTDEILAELGVGAGERANLRATGVVS
ncbi:MAG TPA: CoA transferase [Myxococcota bacterium]|nr:CoA transferase [Myxococcota bacterium]